jgi:hypothetical protein
MTTGRRPVLDAGRKRIAWREGMRFNSRSFNCDSLENRKSTKSRAAAGWSGLHATLTVSRMKITGSKGTPLYRRTAGDVALDMRPVGYGERKLSGHNELDTPSAAALEYLFLLRQPAEMRAHSAPAHLSAFIFGLLNGPSNGAVNVDEDSIRVG